MGGTITASPYPLTTKTMNEKLTLQPNIDLPESVNQEADRIEEDPEAMLRLVDYLFFLKDDDVPS